jgi:hypothetical protein
VIMGNVKNSRDLRFSQGLALALLRAVLYVLPVFGPLFAPLKWQATARTNFGFKPVLDFGYRWHS